MRMELRRCIEDWPFPDPREAEEEGLLAFGGDLRPERLLSAYAQGVFPWYESNPILWFSPDPRMVLVPRELRISRSLKKTLRQNLYTVSLDTVFERVIRACAEIPRFGQDGTWITPEMIDAYVGLHHMGYAHSTEAWRDGELVGGAYGISLGSVFFGESMFATESDASKVAFVSLVQQLEAWEIGLIDCQMSTPHLASFGATEWTRDMFLDALARGTEQPTRMAPWSFNTVP
jgi:leucyl/phenylalanyl-tRNA--protein transferase